MTRSTQMRDRETIERELAEARGRLEHDLQELNRLVRDKVDVKQRARASFDERKQAARELYQRARTEARDRPLLAAAIVTGVLAATIGIVALMRREARLRAELEPYGPARRRWR